MLSGLLKRRNLSPPQEEAQGLTALLYCPLWPKKKKNKSKKKEKKRGTYELLKFLLWREHLSDSAVRARDSPSKMAREQHEATRYLDSARRCKLSELAPTWSDKQSERPSTSGFTAAGRTACGSICKHCSTEDLSSVCVCEGWEVGG